MLSVALLFLLFCLSFSAVQAEPLRVTVVLSEAGGAYQAFSDSLRNILQNDGIELSTQQANQSLDSSGLYIAVGMKAATKLASMDIPLLSVLVPKAGYEKMLRGSPQHPFPRSAVFLDQPMNRQIALLLAALPGIRHVGVLYSSPPPELPTVRRLLADKNIRLHDRIVDEKQSLNEVLESILNESEVIFVLPDAVVYNAGTIRNILLTAYRKRIPLVGISEAYVKAGALYAVYSTTDQIAIQAAEAVRHFQKTGKLPPSQYPEEFEVSVNMRVARSLDIPIEDADRLREEIRSAP
jgi:putative ABC transport system substrate-binding protein